MVRLPEYTTEICARFSKLRRGRVLCNSNRTNTILYCRNESRRDRRSHRQAVAGATRLLPPLVQRIRSGFAPTAPKSLVTSCPIDEETLISFHNECDGRGGVRLLLGAYADMPVISADFRKMRPLPDMHGNRTAVTTAHRQLCTWATPARVKIKF
jgi:hypothetical protein